MAEEGAPQRQRLGKYEILSELGQGAMGVVYRGRDTAIDREVAIKVVHPHLRCGEQGQELERRFLQEARAAARCLHPNIVTLFDYGEADGAAYLVMEFVEGTELRARLKEAALSPQEARDVVRQVLSALEHAHAKGVVHRDIKPANIILLEGLSVKVADFGVARLDTSDLTSAGAVVGTPTYMSPEALRGKTVDGRADIYSTGMVLLELLAARKPYLGMLREHTVVSLLAEAGMEPATASEHAAIIDRSLRPLPGERYQTAGDFAAALGGVGAGPAANPDATRIRSRSPAPVPSAAPAPDEGSGVQPEVAGMLEKELARYVGPMARLLVRKASSTALDAQELVATLAGHIPSEQERSEFLGTLERTTGGAFRTSASGVGRHAPDGPGTGGSTGGAAGPAAPAAFPPERLVEVGKHLAYHVGPLATRLVKAEARRSGSLEELYSALAAHIPDPAEREAFLARCRE